MNSQFNAIDHSQQLQAVGVTQTQAEMHAKLLSQALTNCAASRADLNQLGETLTARMSAFEERVTARLNTFEARMDASATRMTARVDALEAHMVMELTQVRGEQKLLRWMCATNTAMLIAVIVKVYFP
jgi:hypothetical protein